MARPSTTATSARAYLGHLRDLVDALDADAIDRFAEVVFEAWRDDRQVFVFGNGGSAATASHYVTDFVKTASVPGVRRLRCHCLLDNVPMTTALGNDLSFDDTLIHPLESYARPGDVAVAITGSGTSANVVRACEWARAHEVYLVALTGFDGGVLGAMADLHVNVASENYGPIEDLHMSIGHVVTQSLQARVAREAAGG
jgi:D-sedoheptulose 7-phosphate isomerase